MRTKYNAEKVSPTPSQESLVSQHSAGASSTGAAYDPSFADPNPNSPFMPRPFCKYTGHTSDLLDVSWSKNYFVLSSSMDKTVCVLIVFLIQNRINGIAVLILISYLAFQRFAYGTFLGKNACVAFNI